MIKIFIAHYSKLVERKAHMIEQFKKQNITNYEFVEKYDKDELTEKDLSIYTYVPSTRMSVFSLSLKKFYIFQQIRDYHEYALILEDDVILSDNFMDTLQKYMTELPKTYDMLFLGCGLGFHIQPELILPNKHIYRKCLYPTPWGGDGCTRGADCYLMTKECAKKLCWYMYEKKAKPKPHVDFILNDAARDMNLEVYWSEPTLAVQGSVTGLFNTSVITSNEKDWVLVFMCNENTVNKTFQSIVSLRRSGEWKADIVLMVNDILFNHGEVNEFAKVLHVILRKIPERSLSSITSVWDKFPTHRGDIFKYNKFNVFDTFFKRWDYVLYLEAFSPILKHLYILKECEPSNCLYSHNDGYSSKIQTLLGQFDFNMISSTEKFQMLYKYNMLSDFFQTDIFIYDTKIIESNTVNRLFELAETYPNSIKVDQGIMNLYFNCERNLWKKTPVLSMAKSQLGQDLNVLKFYNGLKKGYFIEVGANDGITLSNTYFLEKMYDWTGLCIEPVPDNYNKLVSCRPNSICCDKAVYNVSGLILEFNIANDDDLLSGISAHLDSHKKDVDMNKTTIKVTTISLTDLLDTYKAPKFIEYLSLDTEGSEYEILKSFNFEKYRFGLLDVEHNYIEPRRTQMRELLISKGYVYLGENEWDDSYKHSSL